MSRFLMFCLRTGALGSVIYEADSAARPRFISAGHGLEAFAVIGIFIAAAMGSGFQADIPPQPAGEFFLMVALLAIPSGHTERGSYKGLA